SSAGPADRCRWQRVPPPPVRRGSQPAVVASLHRALHPVFHAGYQRLLRRRIGGTGRCLLRTLAVALLPLTAIAVTGTVLRRTIRAGIGAPRIRIAAVVLAWLGLTRCFPLLRGGRTIAQGLGAAVLFGRIETLAHRRVDQCLVHVGQGATLSITTATGLTLFTLAATAAALAVAGLLLALTIGTRRPLFALALTARAAVAMASFAATLFATTRLALTLLTGTATATGLIAALGLLGAGFRHGLFGFETGDFLAGNLALDQAFDITQLLALIRRYQRDGVEIGRAHV